MSQNQLQLVTPQDQPKKYQKKQLKPNKKLSTRIDRLANSKIFLIVPALVVIASGSFVSVNSSYNNVTSECQNLTNEYSDLLDKNKNYCQFKYLEKAKNEQYLADFKNNLISTANKQKEEINQLSDNISNLKKQSEGLMIDVNSDYNFESNTAEKIRLLTDYRNMLVNNINEKQQEVYNTVQKYEYVINLGTTMNYSEFVIDHKKKFEEFSTKSPEEKNMVYYQLKVDLKDLQARIYSQAIIDNRIDKNLTFDQFYEFKILSSEDFHKLSEDYTKTNETITTLPSLTGNNDTDKVIYDFALTKGYSFRPLVSADKLQPVVYNKENFNILKTIQSDLDQMIQSAQNEGIVLNISSLYRDTDYQKEIFLNRLNSACLGKFGVKCDYNNFNLDKYKESLDYALNTAAPSGMSKHHTGLAVDFKNIINGQSFGDSTAFQWLSRNNYYNAKKFGFIPSYPPGLQNVGPEPEPWEYVWVGKDGVKL